MWNILKTLGAFGSGIIVAFACIIIVELVSNALYPLPADFDQTPEQICLHVASFPAWVLAFVVFAWGLIGCFSCWVARRIGNVVSATMLGVLLVAAVGLNLSMLPYAMWFKIVIAIVMPSACLLGAWIAARGQSRDAQPVISGVAISN